MDPSPPASFTWPFPLWLPDGYSQIFRLYVSGPSCLKDYGSATLHNVIPYFPWIVSPALQPWHNPRKGRGQIVPSGNTVNSHNGMEAAAAEKERAKTYGRIVPVFARRTRTHPSTHSSLLLYSSCFLPSFIFLPGFEPLGEL